MFKIIKRYYDKKIYSNDDVKKFVSANKLTAEQYKQITGLTYKAL